MKTNYFYCISIFLLFQFSFGQITDELKAFPSAEGDGKYVVGGRQGPVVMVSNLQNSGDFSLRNAWETEGPAYIVYEVAGYINVGGNDITPTDYKTVIGQSAFRNNGQGISLRLDQNNLYSGSLVGVNGNRGNNFGEQNVRYMRFRRGGGILGECCGDNFSSWGTPLGLIYDHCSFMLSTDQNLSFPTVGGYTVQYSISAFGLKWATHQYNKPGDSNYPRGHSKGSLTSNTENATWYGNLFANNDDRNPLIQAKNTGITKVTIVNNYFYNKGFFGVQFQNNGGTFNVDMMNNFWKNGPNSHASRWNIMWPDVPTGSYTYGSGRPASFSNPNYLNHRLYVSGNLDFKRNSLNQDEWDVVGNWYNGSIEAEHPEVHQVNSPINSSIDESILISATRIENDILSHVGASLNYDNLDNLAIQGAIDNTGSIINWDGYTGDGLPSFTSFTGGYPALSPMISTPVDTDKNGIEDELEVSGATFPNSIQIPEEIDLANLIEEQNNVPLHNIVIPYFHLNNDIWYNPGYELIEVRYFNSQDLEAMTWVPQETADCTADSIIPEYQLDGVWESGQSTISVVEGTKVVLSMLPNNIGLTITLPDGTSVGDDYNLGNVTSANTGTYVLTSAEGCETEITLNVVTSSIDCPDYLQINSTEIQRGKSRLIGKGEIIGVSSETNGSECAVRISSPVGEPLTRYSVSVRGFWARGIRKGDQYAISLDGKSGEGNAYVEVVQDDTPNTSLFSAGFGDEWESKSGVFTVPSDGSTLDIYLYSNYGVNNAAGDSFFDNLSFALLTSVDNVTINEKAVVLEAGQTTTLTAKVTPTNATEQDVSWSSNNRSIATVNEDTGEVTAVGPGRVVISAGAKDDSGAYDNSFLTITSSTQSCTDLIYKVSGPIKFLDPKWEGGTQIDPNRIHGPINFDSAHTCAHKVETLYGGAYTRLRIPIDLKANNIVAGDVLELKINANSDNGIPRVDVVPNDNWNNGLVKNRVTANSGWTTISEQFTVPSGASHIFIRLYANNDFGVNEPGFSVYDDLSVKKVESTNCNAGSIIPEYRLDGVWGSGQSTLNVDAGTEVMLSMLPNNIGVTVTLPDGKIVGDDFNLGTMSSSNNGRYLLTSAEGCQTTIDLNVVPVSSCPETLANEDGSIYFFNPVWEDNLQEPDFRFVGVGGSETNNSDCALKIEKIISGSQQYARLRIPLDLRANGLVAGDRIEIKMDANGSKGRPRVVVVNNVESSAPYEATLSFSQGAGWESRSQRFTVPEGLSQLYILLYANAFDNGAGYAVYDNLSVKKIGGTALKTTLNLESIAMNKTIETLSAYPNPTTNATIVDIPEEENYTTFAVYSVNGALVRKGKISGNQHELHISFSQMVKGTYILRLSNSEGEEAYKKIVKK